MAEIIDLTIDEPVVSIAPSVANRRTRAPPKCGYCGIQGHTVRSCNDPATMNIVRELQQKINHFPPMQTIIDWLQTIDEKRLQMVVCKYTFTRYRKCSKAICINILTSVITDRYRAEERRTISSLYSAITQGYLLGWTTNQNIVNLYKEYYAQYFENEPSEEECELLRNIITRRTIPPTIQYTTAKLFYNFIIYRYTLFMEAETGIYHGRVPDYLHNLANRQSVEIKYVITKKIIAEPKQIDCPICFETKTTPNILTTTCDHQFCEDCLNSTISKQSHQQRCVCPLCRTPICKIIHETL